MTPEESKLITDSFRYELSQFSKNKIDPLIQTAQENRKTLVDHGERLAAHRQRIEDVEKDVDRAHKGVRAVTKSLDTAKTESRSSQTRVLAIIITALIAILAAVFGLGFVGG